VDNPAACSDSDKKYKYYLHVGNTIFILLPRGRNNEIPENNRICDQGHGVPGKPPGQDILGESTAQASQYPV
jgi:hypothetical protein